jgi:glycosyltransferase involved in cell wall biosynthesis
MPPEFETRVRNNVMAKHLQKSGYEVKIFAASTLHNTDINLMRGSRSLFVEKNYDGLSFVHIRTSDYTGNGFSRIVNMLQFPLRFVRVARRIDPKPDVIICDLEAIFAPIPYLVSRRLGSKFILEVRDLWPESIVEYKGISRRNVLIQLLYKIEKWIYEKADEVVFSMEGGMDYIRDKGWCRGIDEGKIHYINNGVDLQSFNDNKENCITEDVDLLNTETFKVVYAGSLRKANNVKKILDVALAIHQKGLDTVEFFIYGEGPDRQHLEQFCLDNNLTNVKFKGLVDKRQVPYILTKCDLNIMHFEQNSLKKYGASLNKMFEYFASGRPTLSDCEFGYDLIKKYKCGIVIDDATPAQLADAIAEFCNMSTEEYEIYCQNALMAASDYDLQYLSKQLERIL